MRGACEVHRCDILQPAGRNATRPFVERVTAQGLPINRTKVGSSQANARQADMLCLNRVSPTSFKRGAHGPQDRRLADNSTKVTELIYDTPKTDWA
jgi:hypothetical protein